MPNKSAKTILVGNPKVGKSSLIRRLLHNKFLEQYIKTLNVDFTDYGHSAITLQIWDFAGVVNDQPIYTRYFSCAKAVILCFDVNNKDSFRCINAWNDLINRQNDGFFPSKFLVACQCDSSCDSSKQRKISKEAGEALAKTLGAMYVETSAKNNIGIKTLFNDVQEKIREFSVDDTMNTLPKPLSSCEMYTPCAPQGEGLTKRQLNPHGFFAMTGAGMVGGMFGVGIGMFFSGVTFGSSVLFLGMLGFFIGGMIGLVTYFLTSSKEARAQLCCGA